MKIEVKQTVDIPIGLYCNRCMRKESDMSGDTYCSLFNRYIYIRRGNYLKCRECIKELYDAIERKG